MTKKKVGLRIIRDSVVRVGPRCNCGNNTWVNVAYITVEGKDKYLECTECKRKVFVGSIKERDKDGKKEKKQHAA